MQYAFLIYRDEENFADVPADEVTRRTQCMQKILTETAQNGSLGTAVRLEDTTESKTARHCQGTVTVLDGPFAETKEFLAGILVIDCQTESEAENWAKRLTEVACSGTVEYRRVAGLYPPVGAPEPALASTCL